MKNLSSKFLISVIFILIGFFSIFFTNKNIFAVNNFSVETAGYTILSPDVFVFSGYYSNNFDKKEFTTYFEYKKDDENLDVDPETTIPIVRNGVADVNGDFYTSPELNKFSTYYFRAVAFFNDDPGNKIYGSVSSIQTGQIVIPTGATYPYLVRSNGTWENQKVTCTPPEVYSFLQKKCTNLDSIKCTPLQSYDYKTRKCLDTCISPQKYNVALNRCVDPSTTPTVNPPVVTPPTGGTTKGSDTNSDSGSSNLVKCGTYNEKGEITNPCDFPDVINLINDLVKYIFILVIPFAAIMFAYAGFEMITSGGNSEKKSQAKNIILNVAIGLIIVAASFLIVQTVLQLVGYDTGNGWYWFGF